MVGAPIAERLRDPRLDEIDDLRPPARAAARGRGGRARPTARRRAWTGWRVRLRLARPLAGGHRRHHRRRRNRRSPGSSARSGPGPAITIRAAGRGIRGVVALGGPTRGRLQGGAGGRAPVGRARRRFGRDDPRRRLAGRCRDADPGPGDGRLRRGRRRAVEQGTARLPRLGGTPARGAPSAAAVRRPGPRRRDAPARWPVRSRPCSARWPATRWRSSPTRRCSSSTCPNLIIPRPAVRPRADPDGLARRARGPLRAGDRPAPVRRRRPPRGRHRPLPGRDDGGGPARRPRTVRLRHRGIGRPDVRGRRARAPPSATLGGDDCATNAPGTPHRVARSGGHDRARSVPSPGRRGPAT